MPTAVTSDLVRLLPKVELHMHLEGTFPPEKVGRLAAAVGETPPRPLDRLFEADNLADFLTTLDWVCGLVRDAATAEEVALDFARYAAAQGMVYAEVIANPTHWSGLPTEELFAAFARGFDRAQAEGLPDVRLLPSILRQQSEADASALVEWMGTCGIDRIVGLSIDGNEEAAGRTGPRFAPAYHRAHELGFGRTAHAGESSGSAGVRDAIELLGVSRIDHGIRCVEDAEVLELVRSTGTTLNVCVTSNCTLLYRRIEDHPLPQLVAAGVPVTINTDDPETLSVTLCSEIELAAGLLGWSMEDLVAMERRAVDACFCDDGTKAGLHARLDAFVTAHLGSTA